MTKFKKYQSIENHYREEYINSFNLEAPFVIMEKLDGCNIQILFRPNKPYLVGKRSSYITKENNFNDIWNTLDKYKEEFKNIQSFCNFFNTEMTYYGELYGKGIQKRVDYGDEKYIKFFDCFIDDKFMDFDAFAMLFGTITMMPYIHSINATLEDALNLPFQENSEGYVIKPRVNIYNQFGRRFVIKRKSPAFVDKQNTPTPKHNLHGAIQDYINENRVLDCFSKIGMIEYKKDIPKYIRYILDDAIIDFDKDHPDLDLTPKERKQVYNPGSSIANLLLKHI